MKNTQNWGSKMIPRSEIVALNRNMEVVFLVNFFTLTFSTGSTLTVTGRDRKATLRNYREQQRTRGRVQRSCLQALAHRQNIPLAILEPGGFRTARSRDTVLHLHPWHVVFLEHHASGL
jgi:hypothetical protein